MWGPILGSHNFGKLPCTTSTRDSQLLDKIIGFYIAGAAAILKIAGAGSW